MTNDILKEEAYKMQAEQIQALFDISLEGTDYLAQMGECGAGNPEAEAILQNLREIAGILAAEIDGTGLRRQIHLYAKNIQASIDDLCARPALYERIIRMEIRPFVFEMQRLWELDTKHLATAERRTAYRKEIMEQAAALHHSLQREYKYDVSVKVLAYNKLEYTKYAVESILTHTDFSRGNIELILLNNGSDDGTREYFESIPHAKVMNLRHNILGTYAYTHILEGRYFVGFSNDVVATPHWLEHLLACMESDKRIAMAVPVCNEESISNCQGRPVPYPNTFAGMEAMQEFAAEHNQLNPALWEERSQLMPFLAIVRTELQQVSAADSVYTRAEFVDDDVSTLLRRTGWRQVLLRDTFVHHFGGVSLTADRQDVRNTALQEMRSVYYEKWGVDAWNSRGGFPVAEIVGEWHTLHGDECVLILEPRFGDFACEILNGYRRRGIVPHMTAAVFDTRYQEDTGYLFDTTVTAAGIAEFATQGAGKYDVISAGVYLDELPLGDVIADIERLYALLTPGGMLLLPVRNPVSAYELISLMDRGTRDLYSGAHEVKSYRIIPGEQLFSAIRTHPYLRPYKLYKIVYKSDMPFVERMTALQATNGSSVEQEEQRLSVRMFYLGLFKEN